MDWKDRQEMRNDSWYTHDLRLTTKERMNVLANHQTTHKDELADHQINKPVHTNELAKELSLSLREKKKTKINSNLDWFYYEKCLHIYTTGSQRELKRIVGKQGIENRNID